MRRIALIVEYDGTNYGGWQRQNNAPSIQEELEKNIKAVTGEASCVQGSGRTDSGVHALAQTAHFDTDSRIPAERFSQALNAGLPPDIRVRRSFEAPQDFHARFSAKRKHYRYVIDNSPTASAIYGRYRLHYHAPLDADAMQKAAEFIVGEHDFACFKAAGTVVKSTVRTVYRCDVTKENDIISIDVEGNGFLYNMVRIIAGTLIEIGAKKYPPERVKELIESRDRKLAGATAPAKGLTLVCVEYPS